MPGVWAAILEKNKNKTQKILKQKETNEKAKMYIKSCIIEEGKLNNFGLSVHELVTKSKHREISLSFLFWHIMLYNRYCVRFLVCNSFWYAVGIKTKMPNDVLRVKFLIRQYCSRCTVVSPTLITCCPGPSFPHWRLHDDDTWQLPKDSLALSSPSPLEKRWEDSLETTNLIDLG